MSAARVSDGTMPWPVPHPDGLDAPCSKTIPKGWTSDEGHGGGHCWMSAETAAILDGGHYDARTLLAGEPADSHDPADCGPDCLRYWEGVQR